MHHRYRQLYMKLEDDYENFAEDIEQRFNTTNYDVEIPVPIGENKK